MWMWLCVERERYLGFGNRVRMRKIGRNIEAKKDAKRVVYMVMDQKAQEAVEKVDFCRDGCELLRIGKQRVGEKKDNVGVSYLKDKSGTVGKVSVDDCKKIWKDFSNTKNLCDKLINKDKARI